LAVKNLTVNVAKKRREKNEMNNRFPNSQSTADPPVLPPGWTWTTLGDVTYDPQYGWTTSAAEKGSIRLLRTTDITGGKIDWDTVPYCDQEPPDCAKYLLHDGDIVISRAGSVGFSHLVKNPQRAVFASYLIRFRPLTDEKFLAFFLRSPDYWNAISEKSLGIAIPNVNASKLKQIPLPLPPLPEQRRIVAKIEELFSKLDAGVEALKKVKAELKRYRQAVLKYAFEGKLTEEWREAHKGELEPAYVLLERIKEERKKKLGSKYKELPPLDTSELPDLPEGWAWARVGQIADSIEYGYTASAEEEEVGPKFLRITDIQNSVVDWDKVPYCRIDENRKHRYLLREGDLVFARTGATVGKSYLIRKHVPEAVFASYLIRIRSYRDISSKFLYSFFQSAFYWRQITESQVGIGQPNVNGAKLAQIVFPLPPFHEQQLIVSEIERRFSVADEVEKVVDQSLKQAERLRQSILKRAFEGKLVPQDPTDPPAIQLLEEIRKQKENAAATTRKGQHSLRRASEPASVLLERIKKEKERQTAKNAKKHKE
jgi:type I restriction enzyme S subunit